MVPARHIASVKMEDEKPIDMSDYACRFGMFILTVESVFQFPTRCELNSFNFVRRKDCLQDQGEEIVSQHPSSHFTILKPQYPIDWPVYILLQMIDGRSQGTENRWNGASRYIVAEKSS